MNFVFDPSLVLYLPLYEMDGASFASRDAYGHRCTVTGALWRPNGRYFDAVNDGINCGTGSNLNLGNTMDKYTMTAWIKTSYAADEGEIFYKTISPQPMRMAITPATAQVILYDGANNPSVSGTVTVNDGSPHFIAGVVDRPDSEIVLYIDGEYNNKATDTTVGDLRNSNALLIGKKDNGSQPFGGIIGEVAIYNRRLTAQEIQGNYLATKWRYR